MANISAIGISSRIMSRTVLMQAGGLILKPPNASPQIKQAVIVEEGRWRPDSVCDLAGSIQSVCRDS